MPVKLGQLGHRPVATQEQRVLVKYNKLLEKWFVAKEMYDGNMFSNDSHEDYVGNYTHLS